ncbi:MULTISPECIES: flagellar biosynthetic protein FliO [Pseudomonas]|uniref:Flagellar protein n=1 Tax=Pseudomonas sediminis TaxID=1691904 RepID=A0ABX6SNW1_9PSED|nr:MULTISPECIES: flagellar biosynthetic protein FliO [Pseudomonas]HBZ93467.1 flagellar biosynthetic protein FliO [Pseudomonas sp.]PKQ40707.1 flagellar biosynthetic protein FliO [Pseudomonas sp. YY-1]QNH03141.1 flagellar biosynthetic protein FliO [Pseudomonas sediminis]RRV42063.1 flagellar biosynthetic protein FliO [Pseudomonas sp. o96-267]TRO20817.1 flagellar biosynthetic protein FliO [Pseudomonas mendocina]
MARLLALFLSMPLAAMAAEPAGKAATPMAGSDIAGQLGQLLLGLLLVIGLIFLLAWLLRRVQQLNPKGGQVIKLLSSQALGPRDRLVLVQVGNEQILLGLSAGRITPLHVLKEPVHLADAEQATPEFAQRLMELMGKDQKDKS